MAREDLHFRLRLPEALHDRIRVKAALNRRSMTAEIVSMLEESLSVVPVPGDVAIDPQIRVAVHEAMVEMIDKLRADPDFMARLFPSKAQPD